MPIVWVPSPFHSHAHAMAKQSHHIHYSCLHRDPCMVIGDMTGRKVRGIQYNGQQPKARILCLCSFLPNLLISYYRLDTTQNIDNSLICGSARPKYAPETWGENWLKQHSCEISLYPIVICATCVLQSWSLYATKASQSISS